MIPGVKTITRQYVEELIDFAPTETIRSSGIGELQKDGCVALFNMLVRNGVAYLADEVGMGKTYIGLAVMHLLRYQKPDARVLIITPRRNIQEKWASDLVSFVQQNWRRADHRVKTPQGSPDWPTLLPDRLSDWVRDVHTEDAHDTVLRMTSFSLGIDTENAEQEMCRFREALGALADANSRLLDQLEAKPSNKRFAKVVRKLIAKAAQYDLIIVDEAHNLKYGYRDAEASSNRNENLFHIFCPNDEENSSRPWLLLLSATPMENGDPLSLVRQFEVFGRDQDLLFPAEAGVIEQDSVTQLADEPVRLRQLAEPMESAQRRALQRRLLVRRVGELRLGDGSRFTRNMYRREWRAGGVVAPDQPLQAASISEKLINAVIQKNVFELLQARSGGRFRVGALESFEIYAGAASSLTEVDEGNTHNQQVLPDQQLIADLCVSYRRRFAQEVPHPKLNAVTRMLAGKIAKREKALVFVRRVATTTDLASRVSQAFDDQIIQSLKAVTRREEHDLIDQIDQVWRRKRSTRAFEEEARTADSADTEYSEEQHDISDEEEDRNVSEVVPSLFTWLFRGEHRDLGEFPDILSGRRLREQLEARSRFCLILEENYVDWVLLRPADVVATLAQDSGQSEEAVLAAIVHRTATEFLLSDNKNFRRQFHAVQLAALSWMAEQSCYAGLHSKLTILVDEIFAVPMVTETHEESGGTDIVRDMLTQQGIYPSLARCPAGSASWDAVARGVFEAAAEAADFDFRLTLRRREQIRHMQMAALRHGAPVIDLYLAAVAARDGSLTISGTFLGLSSNLVAATLVQLWQRSTENQPSDAVPHAQRNQKDQQYSGLMELVQIKHHFDLIKKLNFPTLDVVQQSIRPLDLPLAAGQEPRSDSLQAVRTVRRFLNQEMAGQSPTAAAKGGQSDERRHRITTHFRMPGMPWVVVATNVYEEGVDLHTFCRTVVHHGISHTASSVEQRTGRVDRIGGLVQREACVMQTRSDFTDECKIQSLFPYQNDTFEKFQVRRVLANCNRFLQALHESETQKMEEREMDLSERHDIPPQIVELLTSPFDVQGSPWLAGQLYEPDRTSDFSEAAYLAEIDEFERLMASRYLDMTDPGGQGLERHYQICGVQLRVVPKSHREGDHLVIEAYVNGYLRIELEAGANGGGWSREAVARIRLDSNLLGN